MQAMETEPPAPLQVEEELGERAAATTPSSMAAAVMLAALPQAHLLAPGAHGAAAAVVPLLAIGQGLGLEPMRSGGPLKRAPARSLLCVCVCVCVCLCVCVCVRRTARPAPTLVSVPRTAGGRKYEVGGAS